MDRETLVRILGQASGVTGKEPRFEVAEGHRLTLYLGRPGRAMEVTDIRTVTLESDFVAIEHAAEDTLYCATEDLHAVSVRSTQAKAERRAGFS